MVTEQHLARVRDASDHANRTPAWEAESEDRSVPIGPRMRMIVSGRVVM